MMTIRGGLYIAETANKGRGVFTKKAIKSGTIIECSPVIAMTAEQRQLIDQTLLHDYIFDWGADSNGICMAMGYVPVYNHSYTSNCEYVMDYEATTITVVAIRDIGKEEELTINYNGDWDNDKPVWFDVR